MARSYDSTHTLNYLMTKQKKMKIITLCTQKWNNNNNNKTQQEHPMKHKYLQKNKFDCIHKPAA